MSLDICHVKLLACLDRIAMYPVLRAKPITMISILAGTGSSSRADIPARAAAPIGLADTGGVDLLIARNPDPDSRLPYLLRIPLGGGMIFRTSGTWPRTNALYCY